MDKAHEKTPEERETNLKVSREIGHSNRIRTWITYSEAAGAPRINTAKPRDYQASAEFAGNPVVHVNNSLTTLRQEQKILQSRPQRPEDSRDGKGLLSDNVSAQMQPGVSGKSTGNKFGDEGSKVLSANAVNGSEVEHNKSPNDEVLPFETTPPTIVEHQPFGSQMGHFKGHITTAESSTPSQIQVWPKPGLDVNDHALPINDDRDVHPVSTVLIEPTAHGPGDLSGFGKRQSHSNCVQGVPAVSSGRHSPIIMNLGSSSKSDDPKLFLSAGAGHSSASVNSSFETRGLPIPRMQAVESGSYGERPVPLIYQGQERDGLAGVLGIQQSLADGQSLPSKSGRKPHRKRGKWSMKFPEHRSEGAIDIGFDSQTPLNPAASEFHGHSQQLSAGSSHLTLHEESPVAREENSGANGYPYFPPPSQFTPQGGHFGLHFNPLCFGSPQFLPSHQPPMLGNGFTPNGDPFLPHPRGIDTTSLPLGFVENGNFKMLIEEHTPRNTERCSSNYGQHSHVVNYRQNKTFPVMHPNFSGSPRHVSHDSQNGFVRINTYNHFQNDPNSEYSQSNALEPYTAPTPADPTSNGNEIQQTTNSYAIDTNGYSQTYFPSAPAHSQFVRLVSYRKFL